MRIVREIAFTASRFDQDLGNRLRDGTVSDLDLQAARQIYEGIARNPPMNRWGQTNPYAAQRWEQNVSVAQDLYSRVSYAHQMQHPMVTARETQKDYQDPSGVGGWRQPAYDPSFPPSFPQPYPVPLPVYVGTPPFVPEYGRYGHHDGAYHAGAAVGGAILGSAITAAIFGNMRHRGW